MPRASGSNTLEIVFSAKGIQEFLTISKGARIVSTIVDDSFNDKKYIRITASQFHEQMETWKGLSKPLYIVGSGDVNRPVTQEDQLVQDQLENRLPGTNITIANATLVNPKTQMKPGAILYIFYTYLLK